MFYDLFQYNISSLKKMRNKNSLYVILLVTPGLSNNSLTSSARVSIHKRIIIKEPQQSFYNQWVLSSNQFLVGSTGFLQIKKNINMRVVVAW